MIYECFLLFVLFFNICLIATGIIGLPSIRNNDTQFKMQKIENVRKTTPSGSNYSRYRNKISFPIKNFPSHLWPTRYQISFSSKTLLKEKYANKRSIKISILNMETKHNHNKNLSLQKLMVLLHTFYDHYYLFTHMEKAASFFPFGKIYERIPLFKIKH